jgi:hypothetical protein
MRRIALPDREMASAWREYRARVGASFMRLRSRALPRQGADGPWIPADDLRLFWFIQTYRDLSRLQRTLATLRTVYPESEALVVSDGDADPEIRRACERYNAHFHYRARLFGVEHGGEPVREMLDAFLRTDADILFKIDPDTHLRRRFSVMPSPGSPSVFGTVQSAGSGPNRMHGIQGGCMVIPRHAAALLSGSGLLASARLKPPALEWIVDRVCADRAASGLTSYDWTLAWACRELGLSSKNHPEVFSRELPSLIDTLTDRGMAVSHPRFDTRQLSRQSFYFRGLRMAVRDVLMPAIMTE